MESFNKFSEISSNTGMAKRFQEELEKAKPAYYFLVKSLYSPTTREKFQHCCWECLEKCVLQPHFQGTNRYYFVCFHKLYVDLVRKGKEYLSTETQTEATMLRHQLPNLVVPESSFIANTLDKSLSILTNEELFNIGCSDFLMMTSVSMANLLDHDQSYYHRMHNKALTKLRRKVNREVYSND